jgi:hypothetical protein
MRAGNFRWWLILPLWLAACHPVVVAKYQICLAAGPATQADEVRKAAEQVCR